MPRAKKVGVSRSRSATKKSLSPKAIPLPSAGPPADIEESVRRRAYELYEQRGREDGHAMEDWLEAEAEILGLEGEG